MCRIEWDYRNIKAKVSRDDKGSLWCTLLTVRDEFILTMVSGNPEEDETSLVQTALRLLSVSDMQLANRETA